MGQARSPMTDFLIDWYFNSSCKGRKNFVFTPRYADKLLAMPHSAEFLKKSFICDSALGGGRFLKKVKNSKIGMVILNGKGILRLIY
jgi:hypothetical protein